jgi:hypothetical protein
VVPRQEEGRLRQVLGCWKLSDGHCDLVACVATSAMDAVLDDFVAEGQPLGDVELEVFEEGGNACEEADALDAVGFGLLKDCVDKKTAGAMAFGFGTDDDGADLGEVLAVDVEGCATKELVGAGFNDSKGTDVGADFGVGAAEKSAVVAEALDQLVDGVGVLQLRSTRMHGVCVELGARRDRARVRWSCRRGADRKGEERVYCVGVEGGRE